MLRNLSNAKTKDKGVKKMSTDALQMPKNYVIMDVEEMTYLEGGSSHFFSRQACRDGLAAIGMRPETFIAAALTFALARTMIKRVSMVSGLLGSVVTLILGWAAGQVIEFGRAIARGALNNGVDVWWNWNIFREPIGVNYSVR